MSDIVYAKLVSGEIRISFVKAPAVDRKETVFTSPYNDD